MIEEKIWLNQSLFNFKDYAFESNGSLELYLSSYTEDYTKFSNLSFAMRIINNISNFQSKTYRFNHSDAMDLILTFNNIFKSINKIYDSIDETNATIVKKYHTNKTLKFIFTVKKSERVCIIQILNNISDYTFVIVPFEILRTFANLLKNFIDNYISLNIEFANRNLLERIYLNSTQIKDGIRMLPSSINQNNEKMNNSYEILNEDTELKQTKEILDELDSFLGENMENIIVPELVDEKIETKTEKEIILNDNNIINVFDSIENIEELLSSCVISDDMIEPIFSRFIEKLNTDESFQFLPSISENEIKSYKYLSKLLYLNQLNDYFNGKKDIPQIRFLIYKPKEKYDINISLAFDLFTVMIYLRLFIQKLSSREYNPVKNKTLFYILYRYVFDMLSISFIQNIETIQIKTCVMERFKNFENSKFFDNFNEILKNYGINKILINEFSNLVDKFLKILLDNDSLNSIEYTHNDIYKNGKEIDEIEVKIPFNNNLSLEQMLKLINFDLYLNKNNIAILSEEQLKEKMIELVGNEYINDDILKIYKTKTKINVKTKDRIKETNILKACKFYDQGIPSDKYEEFIEYTSNLENEDFDWNKFELEEFDDSIFKVIYVWNENEKNIAYSDFMTKVENCSMDKQILLAKIRIIDTTSIPNEDWDLENL
jgi:hypothetical protein